MAETNESFRFPSAQHFTTGTVGPKGQRAFFLQFGNLGEIVTLKLEKGQVSALAEYLDQLLGDVGPILPDDVPLALDLIEPVEPAWAVASIGVAFNEDNNEFVVVAEEFGLDDTDEEASAGDDDDPATAQIHLSPGQIKSFVERARDLVSSGRPPCVYCSRPLDGTDNWCPCFN